MTSIPVRKGTTVNRSGALKDKTQNSNRENFSRAENDKKKQISKENRHNPRPLVHQSSKKQLEDENARLHHEILAYEKRLSNLESTLSSTQEELTKSQDDSVKAKDTCERTLLTCNINPVTLQKITPNSEEENELMERRNNAKMQVSVLQEKLENLNTQASSCIQRINDISAELENMETIKTVPKDNPKDNVNLSSETSVTL